MKSPATLFRCSFKSVVGDLWKSAFLPVFAEYMHQKTRGGRSTIKGECDYAQ